VCVTRHLVGQRTAANCGCAIEHGRYCDVVVDNARVCSE
jgi:hypothetical protein